MTALNHADPKPGLWKENYQNLVIWVSDTFDTRQSPERLLWRTVGMMVRSVWEDGVLWLARERGGGI